MAQDFAIGLTVRTDRGYGSSNDQGIAPAKGAGDKATGAGLAADRTVKLQPAVRGPASTVHDQAASAEAATAQAKAALTELEAAAKEVSELYSRNAAPAQNAAMLQLEIAHDKAERTAANNLKEQRANLAVSQLNADSVRDEHVRCEHAYSASQNDTDLKIYQKAGENWHAAEAKLASAKESVKSAEALRDQVLDTFDRLSADCAVKRYPSLVVADAAAGQANQALIQFDQKYSPEYLDPHANVVSGNESDKAIRQVILAKHEVLRIDAETAATTARAGWMSARDDAHNAGDKVLEQGCEARLHRAENVFMEYIVTNKYPSLRTAQEKYWSATHQVNPDSHKTQAAALEVRNAWVIAGDKAKKANDTSLAAYCQTRLKEADENVTKATGQSEPAQKPISQLYVS